MPPSASIEANEYSRWDDDDFDPQALTADAVDEAKRAVAPAVLELRVDAGAGGERLDKWLAGRLADYSRSRLQRWIADGHVRVNGEIASTRHALWTDDVVVVSPQPSDDQTAFAPEDVPLAIVHEDDALIVIDKRAGLVVHPASGNWSGTVLNGLLHHDPALAQVPRAGIVHRLDKDTSGLMVVARTVIAQTDLVRQLQARTVGRTYVALVHGAPPKSGRIDLSIGRNPRERTRMAAFPASDAMRSSSNAAAKPAATRFETLASVEVNKGGTASLVVCKLETGRTHQIRVHMQAIGHPLIGDATYGSKRVGPAFARQALHACRLKLVHPSTHIAMGWTARIPDDLAVLADSLGIDIASDLSRYAARAVDA
ncbi:MAG: RluA family pseudouridine synthase [Burkholderiaceae bacterium]